MVHRRGVGQHGAHLAPVRVRPGPGGLGQVAEHGDRARRCPAGDHAELHRREVLGLVDDDVPVAARPPPGEERGFVEEGQIVDAPCGRGHGGVLGPDEQHQFLGGEEPASEAFQSVPGRQQFAHERGGRDRRPQQVQQRGELVRGDQLTFEPRLVSTQTGGGPEDAAGFADQTGPQGQATRLVRCRTRHDRSHEVVHRRHGQRPAGEADSERDVLLQPPSPPVEGATQELGHAGVGLHPAHLHGLLHTHLGLGGDVGDGGLHHRLLTEGGEDLRDVAQEGPARAEHEDAVPAQGGVVVEEEGGPVQAHRRLAGTRPTLDGQQLFERGPDDLVLLGLDGGDNVEHLAGTGPLELGQEGIASAEPGGRAVVTGSAEEIVGHGHHGVAIDHDLTPAGQAEGVGGAGPVEGHGHRSPPVDHDRVRPDVLHVAPTDVPRGAIFFVDAAEEEWARAVGQQGYPTRECGHVVEVRVAGGNEVVEQSLGAVAHGGQRFECMVQVGLLGGHLRIGRGRGHHHHVSRRAKARTITCARKVPGHTGDHTWILLPIQAPQLVFCLLVRPDFEPLSKGCYRPSL